MRALFPAISSRRTWSNAQQHYSTTHNNTFTANAALQKLESLQYPFILNKTISCCAKSCCLSLGTQLHSHVIKVGFHHNVYINTSLVDMYGKCMDILSAQKVFDEMCNRNSVTWNALISGYVKARDPDTAIELFINMKREDIPLTPFGVSAALVACAQLEDSELGAQLHSLNLKEGLEFNVVVGSGLIDMYAKCRNVENSRKVFLVLTDKSAVDWTSMIAGYARNHCPKTSMILIKEMFRSGLKANYVTYNSMLSSFRFPDDSSHCRQIHCRLIHEGLESHPFLITAILIAYSECGCRLKDFYTIISSVSEWDQIAWNAVIAGFSNLGLGEEAYMFFSQMRKAGHHVDFFTFSSVLKALGKSSSLEEGKQIHALLFKTWCVQNINLWNGLVSMYARCGEIDDAKKVFSSMDSHDVVSWNSLLTGCAHHGHGREAIQIFEQMRKSGVSPNHTTFLAALTACSHVGLLEKGLEYFDLMKSGHLPPAQLEHYACIVDLYGRAGLLDQAEAFINSMPIKQGPLEDDADDVRDENPEYLGAPMYESEAAPEILKETARQHPRAVPVVSEKHRLPNRANQESAKENEPISPNMTMTETISEKLGPAYSAMTDATNKVVSKLSGLAIATQETPERAVVHTRVHSGGHEIARNSAEIIGAAPPPSSEAKKMSEDDGNMKQYSPNSSQTWDKGVSVKEYFMHKLEPGDDERALSQAITEAISPRKTTTDSGVIKKVKGAVTSLFWQDETSNSMSKAASLSSSSNTPTSTQQNRIGSTHAHSASANCSTNNDHFSKVQYHYSSNSSPLIPLSSNAYEVHEEEKQGKILQAN